MKIRKDSFMVAANDVRLTDRLVTDKGNPRHIASIVRNPRGCPGNVHVFVQNSKMEVCYFGGSQVEVMRNEPLKYAPAPSTEPPETD